MHVTSAAALSLLVLWLVQNSICTVYRLAPRLTVLRHMDYFSLS